MGIWSELLNLGFALFFGGFVLFGIREACRAYWPVHKAKLEAQSKKAEAEAALAVATGENQRELIGMTDRNTQMLSAVTNGVALMATNLGDTRHDVRVVLKHLLDGCECDKDGDQSQKRITDQG